MAEHGWDAESKALFQLSAERLVDRTFSVARIWHTAARLHRSGVSDSDSVLILIGVDGEGTVTAEGRDWDLGPRQIAIVDTGTPVQVSWSGTSARLEVSTERNRLGAVQMLLRRRVEVVTVEDSYWRTLASLIVTVLNTNIDSVDAGFVSLKAAIEHTITAAVVQSPLSAHPAGRSHTTLLNRAQRIVEERFADPEFSAGELARSLSISSAHLHRVFGSASVTPYQFIQQRRVSRASDLLRGDYPSESSVATQSGFRSSRAMRRALQRHRIDSRGTSHDRTGWL